MSRRRPKIIEVEGEIVEPGPAGPVILRKSSALERVAERALSLAASSVFIALWITGIVLAKGFWSTLFAFFIPPWGWYLVAERLLIINGWIT